MERRRRACITDKMNALHNLAMDLIGEDPKQYQKTEKADLLNICYAVFENVVSIVKEQPEIQLRIQQLSDQFRDKNTPESNNTGQNTMPIQYAFYGNIDEESEQDWSEGAALSKLTGCRKTFGKFIATSYIARNEGAASKNPPLAKYMKTNRSNRSHSDGDLIHTPQLVIAGPPLPFIQPKRRTYSRHEMPSIGKDITRKCPNKDLPALSPSERTHSTGNLMRRYGLRTAIIPQVTVAKDPRRSSLPAVVLTPTHRTGFAPGTKPTPTSEFVSESVALQHLRPSMAPKSGCSALPTASNANVSSSPCVRYGNIFLQNILLVKLQNDPYEKRIHTHRSLQT
ncbi:hypothetical protein CLF_101737, partial [Clonorchis sinensis]